MTEITVTTQQYLPGDRPWLLFEAVGHQGPTPTWHADINLSLFTANTHYPNGFIPSGIALGRVTAGGRVGPYDNAASDGRQTCIGFLYNPISTANGVTANRKVAAAVIDSFAVVSRGNLPTGNGLDTAGEAELPLIKFRA